MSEKTISREELAKAVGMTGVTSLGGRVTRWNACLETAKALGYTVTDEPEPGDERRVELCGVKEIEGVWHDVYRCYWTEVEMRDLAEGETVAWGDGETYHLLYRPTMEPEGEVIEGPAELMVPLDDLISSGADREWADCAVRARRVK